MAPPQVNLNQKPPKPTVDEFQDIPSLSDKKDLGRPFVAFDSCRYNDLTDDPLPEKKDGSPVILTTGSPRRTARPPLTPAQLRKQRKRRIACCVSLTLILVLLAVLGTVCLVYRYKHKKGWNTYCGTPDKSVPEHVEVNHQDQLIYVRPNEQSNFVMNVIHEYNRRLIAFLNTSVPACYIDRLDETFEEGYSRWQLYEDREHTPNRTLRVVPQPIQVEVINHFGGEYITAHCGNVSYFWAIEVQETEINVKPGNTYIRV